jgi:hypothetical protein
VHSACSPVATPRLHDQVPRCASTHPSSVEALLRAAPIHHRALCWHHHVRLQREPMPNKSVNTDAELASLSLTLLSNGERVINGQTWTPENQELRS